MRTLLASLVVLLASGMIALGLGMANAYAATGCIINVAGIKICGELLGQPLPEIVEVTVTAPPIRIPGPTQTVTVRPPRATVRAPGPTVRIPGPTQTVTVVPEVPQPTGQPAPTRTVTETVTPTPTPPPAPRQEADQTDIVRPEPSEDGFFRFDFDPFDDEVTAGEVTVGLGAILGLLGLILLALVAGYILGYKDKEKKETDFMRALLERAKTRRGQHR